MQKSLQGNLKYQHTCEWCPTLSVVVSCRLGSRHSSKRRRQTKQLPVVLLAMVATLAARVDPVTAAV